MTRYVALLRGINVGPSTRLPMATLREVFAARGSNVRTLLQSGNVVFDADERPDAAAIEAAILAASGVRAPVLLLEIQEIARIADTNPLRNAGDDDSRLVITFLAATIDVGRLDRPDAASLAPERLEITPNAIYQWCPNGILQSRVPPRFWRQVTPLMTARNVRTVEKILALDS